MRKIKLMSTSSKSFGTICRVALFGMISGVLMVTASFGLQLKGVTPVASLADSFDIVQASSVKRPSAANIVSTAGVFSASASSPVPLTCITADPTTGYVYAQQNGGNQYYRYVPFSDSWQQMTSSPLNSGNNGGGAYINGKIYTTYTYLGELGVYTIATNSWTTVTSPLPGTGNITSDGTNLYLAAYSSFVRYNPATNITTTLATPTVTFDLWGGLAIYNGFVYGHTGDGSTGFAKYDIANNIWTTLQDVPDGAVLGCAIDPVGKVYYTYGSYGGSNWYSFDLVSETWTMSAFPLFSGLNDGGMVYVAGTGIYLTFSESSTGFGRIVLTTPTTVASIVRAGTDPVSGPSASWTVTFNDAVSNVNAGNFSLVNTGLGGTPAITSVTPIGGAPATQWTVTAAAGTGNGTLGLDMVNDTAISNAISGLPFVGAVYSFVRTAPVANFDFYATGRDTVLNVSASGVLGNDTDVNSDPLTAVLSSSTTNGALTLNNDGSFRYTPVSGFSGSDSFTYTAFDGTANSIVQTVSISVVAPPTTMAFDAPIFSGPEGTTATVTVTRTGDTTYTSTVHYWTTNGTAVSGTCGSSGAHYEAASGTLTFAATETVKTFGLMLCSDNVSEDPAETVTLSLNNPTGGSVGTQAGAELMVLDAATGFGSTTPIIITPGAPGFPYGTTVNVTGVSGIGGLRVTLYGVTHLNPQDLQVLLVSPNGTGFELMAGTGFNTPLNNATITFEDIAPTYLPDTSAIFDGVNYRPSVCGLTGPFPVPAPVVFTKPNCGISGPTLAETFAGGAGNGLWTLYVQDTGGAGVVAIPSASIGGWGMTPMLVTAAESSLSGRVLTKSGSGIRNAMVTVAGGNLTQPITVITSTFGYYHVKELTAGQAYVVSVTAKRYTFTEPVRAVQLFEDTTGFDFVADR